MKKNKNIVVIVLISLFISWIITSLYLHKIWFDIINIANHIWNNIFLLILVTLFIFSIRIFLFIPSTLLIIWLWAITNNFLLTVIISTIWILIWLLQTYHIWVLIENNSEGSKTIKKIKPHLKKIEKRWFTYILIWCFAPFLPTDIICYSAWFIRYKLSLFLLAWMLWELPLIILYSYLWWNASDVLKNINYLLFVIIILTILFFLNKKYKIIKH